ncbi:MAG: ISAs1 family transposase [Chlamydiae bacterium]|nr:ISAs1 family transposase [Chlamydiota bacterium]
MAAADRLVIVQKKVPDKAGERRGLPALLDSLDVTGAIVSMDALFAHIVDIKTVLKRKADYIVGIKGNQSTLEAKIYNFFEQAHAVNYEDDPGTRITKTGKGHGRTEERIVCVTKDLNGLP